MAHHSTPKVVKPIREFPFRIIRFFQSLSYWAYCAIIKIKPVANTPAIIPMIVLIFESQKDMPV
jgi:hypothetical protein